MLAGVPLASLVVFVLFVIFALFATKLHTTKTEHELARAELEHIDYRLGDLIGFNGVDNAGREMLGPTIRQYPGTIASAFAIEARRRGFDRPCHRDPETCYPLVHEIAQRECPVRLERFKEQHGPLPEVVVHVRTADVVGANGKLNENGQWTGRPVEYYDKLGAVLRAKGISRATIITSFQHRTNGDHEGPRKFLEEAQRRLAAAGVETDVVMTNDADTDFCLMGNAKTLAPTRSGLSELAAEVALANGHRVVGLWRLNDADSNALQVYNPTQHGH